MTASLRLQLAIRAGILAIVALAALAVSVDLALVAPMADRVDDRLVERAAGLAAVVSMTSEAEFPRIGGAMLQGDPGAWAAIRSSGGEVVASAGRSIPPGVGTFPHGGSGEVIDDAFEGFRAFSIAATPKGSPSRHLIVGLPSSEVSAVQGALRVILFVAVLSGGLLVAAGAWFSATLVLLPMRRMTQSARQLSIEQSTDLLPVAPRMDEFGELTALLNELLGKARERLREEMQFSSDVAHELRNPLAAVQARAEGAMRARTREEILEEVSGVLDECDRASRLIEALLTLTRETPQWKSSQPLDPATIASGLIEGIEPLAELAGVGLKSDLPSDGGRAVDVPREVVEICLSVLLDNALRAAGRGGEIEVRLDAQGDTVQLKVSDSGGGVPRDESDRIFLRFQRGTGSASAGGFGLGLPLARRLARSFGGDVRLLNAGEPHACFSVEFPRSTAMKTS